MDVIQGNYINETLGLKHKLKTKKSKHASMRTYLLIYTSLKAGKQPNTKNENRLNKKKKNGGDKNTQRQETSSPRYYPTNHPHHIKTP